MSSGRGSARPALQAGARPAITPVTREAPQANASTRQSSETLCTSLATNRTPSSLVDEAFLRRIQYKIEIKPPTYQEFSEILRRVCEKQKITFYPKAADWIAAYCRERNIPLRSCHPRDLMQHLSAAARFLLKPAELTPELVELACETYFVPI